MTIAQAVTIGFVADVGNALEHLLANEFRDALDQPGLVDLIGNGVDDDALAVAFLRDFDLRLGAHDHHAAAGQVRLLDSLSADDVAAGRKVGSRDELQHLALLLRKRRLLVRLRALDQPDRGVDDLPHVVRRDVRRHANGDARGTVDEQIRKWRRKNRRLFGGLVVVRDEVNRLLVEVDHHLVGQAVEARFRVAHRRGRVTVDRAEVSLPVGEHVAHVEVLRQADQGVVNRRVAVGMVVAHHLADDLCALAITAGRGQPHGSSCRRARGDVRA